MSILFTAARRRLLPASLATLEYDRHQLQAWPIDRFFDISTADKYLITT
jgi:hypothetical protein